jgi:hypothetical protein
MSISIEITHAQAKALVALTDGEQPLAIRQLSSDETRHGGDVYATPHGTSAGYRIAADGAVSEIGETLPAPG